MPIINNAFNGKLNLDVANYRISNGDYIDALNITKDAEGQGQDRVVSNILGNENVAYTLPAGTNKAIGFYADKIRNRAYYFIWNSNGFNTILYYNGDTNVITKVLTSKTDSDGIDILSFNPSYKVLSVNVFYRDDEGDLLFFNDGLNPPKVIKPPTKVLRTVEELVRLLNKVSDAYYEDKYPEFNDYEYNMLLAELKSVDPTHPYLKNY